MAVFDKASLVMIPSQYKEGKIYNIKPEDQSSSFEFERGSAAARVNSSGLIEQTGVSSAELWHDDDILTSGTGSYSNGVVTITASTGNDYVSFHSLDGVEAGNYYQLSFDVVANSGSFVVLQGTGNFFTPSYSISESGSYSRIVEYTHSAPNKILFYSNNSAALGIQFDGTISNISIKKVNIDTPRLDYSGTEPALLLEPQRTNEYLNSNDFSLWYTDASVTSTANQLASPDGNINATLMSVTDSGRIYYDPTISTTADRVLSIFIKGGTFNHFRVGLIGSVALVDLINETSSIGDINSIGNGWYRVSLPPTSVSSTSRRAQIQAYPDNTYTNSHGQSGTYYIYGAQLELGSYPTSYIPTNGQTETRLADVCQGGGDASVFNDSEGTLYLDAMVSGDDGNTYSFVSINDKVSQNDFVAIGYRTDNNTLFIALKANGTTVFVNQSISFNFNQYYKIALKYKSGDSAIWLNGVELDTDTTTFTMSNLKELEFNYHTTSQYDFYGNVRALHYFPEALTDTELQQLTTI